MKFNRVYAPILDLEKGRAKRYVVLKGGAGAGKSRAIAQALFRRIISLPGYKVLAMRKVFNTVRESLFAEFKTVIDEEDMAHLFKVVESPFRYRHLATGNEIIFTGMDDADKLKSISGINCIWLEEADQFELADFLQADIRMRGECNYPYQLFISFNPTSETSWLKSTFFDPSNPYEDESLVLETTFRDNRFLDAAYGKALFNQGASDKNKLAIYMNGQWGRLDTSGLFYKQFDTTRHVAYDAEATYDPELPLWLSWDFNVVPSCTCLVFQLRDERTLVQIAEFTAKSPHNNTAAIARAFLQRFATHRGRVYVTGDPAGRHRDTRSEEGRNDYSIIQNELRQFNPILRVQNVAPNQVSRGDFINAVLSEHGCQGLKLLLNHQCVKTIQDLTNQKETNVGKDKSKVRDKVTGESYEKYGHASDAFDYMVHAVWTDHYENFLAGPKVFEPMFGKNQLSARWH